MVTNRYKSLPVAHGTRTKFGARFCLFTVPAATAAQFREQKYSPFFIMVQL